MPSGVFMKPYHRFCPHKFDLELLFKKLWSSLSTRFETLFASIFVQNPATFLEGAIWSEPSDPRSTAMRQVTYNYPVSHIWLRFKTWLDSVTDDSPFKINKYRSKMMELHNRWFSVQNNIKMTSKRPLKTSMTSKEPQGPCPFDHGLFYNVIG